MAQTTNTCNGTYGYHYTLYLDYNVNWQDTGANKSNITLHMYARSDSTSYKAYNLNATNYVEMSVNGGVVFSRNQSMDFREMKWVDMGSWSGDVYHNNDGTRYIEIGGSFTINGTSSLNGGSLWTGWTLQSIPRYANFTEHYILSTGINSLTVQWGTDAARNWTQYSLNGGSWTNASDAVSADNKRGTYTIKNLNPNTQYSIRTKICRTDSGLWTQSGTIYGTTKDIGKLKNVPDMEFGSPVTITTTNPSGVRNDLQVKLGDTIITTKEKVATTINLSLAQTELDSLYQLLTNNESSNLSYVLQTYNGNNVGWTNTKTGLCEFTGNQKTIRTKLEDSWRRGKLYIKDKGIWKKATVWNKVDGVWRRGI